MLIQKNDEPDYDHARSSASFRKANVKNTESMVTTAMGSVTALRSNKKVKDDGLDLDATTQKHQYMMEMMKSKFLEQAKTVQKIRSRFNPLQCIQQQIDLSKKSSVDIDSKVANWNKNHFDAIWTFEIVGRKFEQHVNPLEVGVFSSAKCYYIVCVKQQKVAIFLWRGENQTNF